MTPLFPSSTFEAGELFPVGTLLAAGTTGWPSEFPWKANTQLVIISTTPAAPATPPLPPTATLAKVMQDLKGNSSRWLNQRGTKFAWQEGFGGFSVSQSQKQIVANYIARQAEHHQKWTFEQEFMTLLRKSGVRIDQERVSG